MSDLDFAALLCSRLCHDLVSPVGAINNGLEILHDEKDPAMRAAVIDLLEKSTQQTANKLQFFRLAFGAAGGFSAQLDMREAEKATGSLLSGSRTELDWQASVPSASKSVVKLLLNVCLVVSETLVRGGTMTVRLDKGSDGLTIAVSAAGGRVIFQEAMHKALLGQLDTDDLEPRFAPAYMVAQISKELGAGLTVESSGESLLVQVKAIADC